MVMQDQDQTDIFAPEFSTDDWTSNTWILYNIFLNVVVLPKDPYHWF